MTTDELAYMSAAAIADHVRRRLLSPVEIVLPNGFHRIRHYGLWPAAPVRVTSPGRRLPTQRSPCGYLPDPIDVATLTSLPPQVG